MKPLRFIAGCAVFAAAASTLCHAADNPWDGTWKLNESKSKMTGSTFSVTSEGSMYDVNTGTINFKFACDGKEYPVIANYSTSCMMQGGAMVTTNKQNGKLLSTTTHEFSPDGKMMTETTKGTRPDGSSYVEKDTYERTGGTGNGFAGTWKNTKTKDNVQSSMVIKVNGDVLHTESPEYKTESDAKLDGTPAPLKGPRVPPGVTLANKSEGPNKVESVVTYNGKEMSKDVMTLSADGKVITDVSWVPGKENEKQTYIYDKQ